MSDKNSKSDTCEIKNGRFICDLAIKDLGNTKSGNTKVILNEGTFADLPSDDDKEYIMKHIVIRKNPKEKKATAAN